MAFPVVNVTFPGLADIRHADITVGRGFTPSTAVLRCVIQDNLNLDPGTLKISAGDGVVEFPDCVPDVQHVRVVYDNAMRLLEVTLKDRRAKWQGGAEVPAEWNQRHPSGRRYGLIGNAREVATALAPYTLDVEALPETVYPRLSVRWQLKSLSELLAMCACDVVLTDDANSLKVVALGVGAELPESSDEWYPPVHFNRTVPQAVQIIGGPSLWQKYLPLKAYGVDSTQVLRTIGTLNYKPDSWEAEWWHQFPNVNEASRWSAFDTVLRAYRLESEDVAVEDLPGLPEVLGDGKIRLEDFQLTPLYMEAPDVEPRKVQPYVLGTFWEQGDLPFNSDDDTIYSGQLQLIKEYASVFFQYPVFKWSDAYAIEEADLKLLTAFHVDDGGPVRSRWTRQIPGGTGPALNLSREELFESRALNPVAFDNVEEVAAEAGVYLDRFEQSFANRDCYGRAYAGIVPIQCDGRIAQVQYIASVTEGAWTKASVGHEFDVYAPSNTEHLRKLWLRYAMEHS